MLSVRPKRWRPLPAFPSWWATLGRPTSWPRFRPLWQTRPPGAPIATIAPGAPPPAAFIEPAGGPAGHKPGRHRAMVKIQEGCDQVCAYCIVPRVRGRERSIPPKLIVSEIGRQAEEGCREAVLTGTQLGTYGFDIPGTDLAGLVRSILDDTSIDRLRVSSLQAQEITPELLDLWSDPRLCPHFHIPLQSGSDPVLRAMRRRYDTDRFARTLDLVRDAVPGVGVTTDIIVGFPGEGDDDFRDGYDFAGRMAFSDIHVFPYSSRPGTTAAHLKDTVDGCRQRDAHGANAGTVVPRPPPLPDRAGRDGAHSAVGATAARWNQGSMERIDRQLRAGPDQVRTKSGQPHHYGATNRAGRRCATVHGSRLDHRVRLGGLRRSDSLLDKPGQRIAVPAGSRPVTHGIIIMVIVRKDYTHAYPKSGRCGRGRRTNKPAYFPHHRSSARPRSAGCSRRCSTLTPASAQVSLAGATGNVRPARSRRARGGNGRGSRCVYRSACFKYRAGAQGGGGRGGQGSR